MLKIRAGIKEDCIAIEAMIKELGVYEKRKDGPNGPIIDRKILERDGFGEQQLLRTIVAEYDSKLLIGYALYFFKYSTYTGKSLYLEDLYVKPDYRHSGAGRALLTAVTKEGAQHFCHYIEWSCLHSNHDSIRFYLKFGAKQIADNDGWLSFKLDKQQMEFIVNESDDNKNHLK